MTFHRATKAQAQAQEALHWSLGSLHIHQLDAHRFIAPLGPSSHADLPFALGLELFSTRVADAPAHNYTAQQGPCDGIISLQYILDGSGQVRTTAPSLNSLLDM